MGGGGAGIESWPLTTSGVRIGSGPRQLFRGRLEVGLE
jgi:hypothetical protein